VGTLYQAAFDFASFAANGRRFAVLAGGRIHNGKYFAICEYF